MMLTGEQRRLAGELSESDLALILDASRACTEAEGAESFARLAAAGLHRLVACDHASYNEYTPGAGFWGCSSPGDALSTAPPGSFEIIAHYAHQSPFLAHRHSPADPPRTFWDLDPAGQMRRTDIWNLFYRPMGIAVQLAASLEEEGPTIVGLGASRSAGEFSDHDRAMLDLYRHQVMGTRKLVVTQSRLARVLGSLNVSTLTLSKDGRVLAVEGDVPDLREGGVLEDSGGRPRLTEAVAAWLARRKDSHGGWSALGTGYRACVVHGPLEDVLTVRPARVDDTADHDVVRVRVLGGFSALDGESEIELKGRAAQVVMLVAASGGQADAEAVIEALWPEIDPEVGRDRLRTVLARVPHSPQRLVVRRGGRLALGPHVEVDCGAFEALSRQALSAMARGDPAWAASAREALDTYGGELLAGTCSELWVFGPRERLHRRQLALLDALVQEAVSRGDRDGALALLEQAIESDPVDESRYLQAARLLAAQGRRGTALGVIGHARAVLSELGLAPPPELEALEASLTNGGEGTT